MLTYFCIRIHFKSQRHFVLNKAADQSSCPRPFFYHQLCYHYVDQFFVGCVTKLDTFGRKSFLTWMCCLS
ncbi:uncharacterized protein PHALS_14931 [Plasmopara halstedii]|uniref:Uncharacterized protein n=1 Tax=Plasmopara halstedii TaxID=4781 RepID=A0A0P1AZY4_PLAHL|nr:uncharacterized protein PHALS_14931 [Plasmopara halstedii]CEG46750.1 hypothetical protein PHALS_14931 [Plasmopara halstedii]|eukprot:XP_024583119.1 hypothetical protein PHALS_14931 [Plasmopara halstedii]